MYIMKKPTDEYQGKKRRESINNAIEIVDDILAGKKDVVQGAKEVFYDALGEYDFQKETKKFIYDSVGLAKAYGLLDTCIDLSESDHRWHKRKTNEQLFEETEAMLLRELKAWHISLAHPQER